LASPETLLRAPVAAGDVLAGKYRVERVLGVGGMGVVVEAKHLKLDERVALKFLRERVMDEPDIVVRFLREARAVAKLKSDHVVRVRDVGNLDNGAPYIVMELLEGETLKERVKREGAMPPKQAVDFLLQACDAIAEAHSHGIIHRDIKPTNLFVSSRPDGRSIVKVFDFGISKVQTADADADAELGMTATTSMLGSPLYMSPEQMVSARNVDVRSDIWSLGVTLYLFVAGVLPFKAETMPQVCALVLGEKPKRLDAVKPGVPKALADVVARCLEKDPDLRYCNVAELASALEPLGSEASQGAAKRVASMLRVPVPPPSSSTTQLAMPNRTTISADVPVEQTEVSFGEASLSRQMPLVRGRAFRVWLAASALVLVVAASVIAFGRGNPRLRTSAGPNATAAPVEPARGVEAQVPTNVPRPTIAAEVVPAADAGAASFAIAEPKAKPATKPKPASVSTAPPTPPAPTVKPGAFDPGSYR